jgi:hypothetical protein
MDQEMDNVKGSYSCDQCKKKYSSYKSLWNHNKKFHKLCDNTSIKPDNDLIIPVKNPDNDLIIPVKNPDNTLIIPVTNADNTLMIHDKKYKCRTCDKDFKNFQNRWKHEKSCKKKITLTDQLKKLELENEQLKMQIMPLNQTTTSYSNSNNNQTNNGIINNNQTNTQNINNNNNINNNVTINQLGTEKINYRTKDIRRIARDGLNGAITCVQKTNFNKDKPENHSFCSSSLDGQYCTTINHKTQKPEKIAKKELFWKVLESSFKIIEGIALQIECNSELREQIPVNEQKKLYDIIDNKSKFYEKKNWKTFYNSINSMSYNYKDLILSTWSMLKAPTIIEESDSDFDSDSEPDIKEVTEFHDSDSDDDFDLLTAI